MEAQSQKLACVATRISAIPELIREGETGILVAPEDAAALAQAMGQLIASPDRRAAMGDAARARIEMDFAMHHCIAPLLPRFGLAPPQPVGEKTVKYAAGPRGSGAVAD